jgi:hypothetical protein
MWLPRQPYGNQVESKRTTIGLREIRALGTNQIIWDSGKGAVAGFGARRRTGAAVTYVLKYRTADGRQRWHVIGRHGSPWTLDMARERARELLGSMAVAAVDHADVERFMYDVAAGKTAAKAKTAKKRGLARVTGGQTAATRELYSRGAAPSTRRQPGVWSAALRRQQARPAADRRRIRRARRRALPRNGGRSRSGHRPSR